LPDPSGHDRDGGVTLEHFARLRKAGLFAMGRSPFAAICTQESKR
jgi:hypothetical protein